MNFQDIAKGIKMYDTIEPTFLVCLAMMVGLSLVFYLCAGREK